MTLSGKIEACLGPLCPTPCCQEQVYIIKEEEEFVIGQKKNIFTGNKNLAKLSNKFIFRDPEKSYIKHCFNGGCKFEKNNPLDKEGHPEKGFMCIIFPLHILKPDWIKTGLIRLDLVPDILCPLTTKAEVIKNHFYDNIVPALKIRFPSVHHAEFKGRLLDIMEMPKYNICAD